MRYVYASDVSDIAYGSFLTEESLSSFLSCMFFTCLYQTVQLFMYYTPVLIELITYYQFCYLSKSISTRQMRLLEKETFILRRPRFRFKLYAYVISNLNNFSKLTCLIITTKQIIKR